MQDTISVAKNGEILTVEQYAKPLLKWAGGKTQLLSQLRLKTPKTFGKYIEPFFGGGALFFDLRPDRSIIADINPELINLYRAVADSVELVVGHLSLYSNSEEIFYEVRAQDWKSMSAPEAAARTIFLNRTCFNGLYRVNKAGGFNVPFGRYKNPKIIDEKALRAASAALSKSTIVLGGFQEVLAKYAEPGDFVFLDPPYLPVSKNSDFKRYNREQFHEDDHRLLAQEVNRLRNMDCTVVLTNSNHPLVHELFEEYEIQIIPTKRHISCNGNTRIGEDVIVSVLQTK